MATRPARETAEPRSRYAGVRMSPEAYLRLPEEKLYLEYFDGRVVQKAIAKKSHARLQPVSPASYSTTRTKRAAARDPKSAAGSTRPATPAHLLPDVSYWAPGKALGDDDRSLPPTLAVEVRSRNESLLAQRRKCRFYRANGIDVAWLVEPDRRTVEVFEAGRDGVTLAGDDRLEPPALPGFSLPLPELFAVLDS